MTWESEVVLGVTRVVYFHFESSTLDVFEKCDLEWL